MYCNITRVRDSYIPCIQLKNLMCLHCSRPAFQTQQGAGLLDHLDHCHLALLLARLQIALSSRHLVRDEMQGIHPVSHAVELCGVVRRALGNLWRTGRVER